MRSKPFWRNALLVLASSLVAVAIAEVGLRAAGIGYPNFYTWDEATGGALRPGAEGWFHREVETYIRINGDGLRDEEHAVEKPDNTLRIAVLGDSYAEAMQVPIEEAFWSVVERELEGCTALGGRRVEAINFGVSGYGTVQELMTLRHKAWKYDPDIVLLAMLTGNDISDNFRATRGDPFRPYAVIRDGRVEIDTSFRDALGFRLRRSWPGRLYAAVRDSSRVMQLVYRAARLLKYGALNVDRRNEARRAARPEPGLKREVMSEPKRQLWKDAWRVTEGALLMMRDEVREHGADFAVATISTGVQVDPDRELRESYRARLGADDLFYADRRIEALGERQGFAVLSLPPLLQAHADRTGEYLHGVEGNLGTGHWNARGHTVAGDLISEFLCRRIAASTTP